VGESGRFVHSGGHREKAVDFCGFEKLKNPRAHTGGDKLNAFVLAADEMTDDQAETTRVYIGNVGEIEDGY